MYYHASTIPLLACEIGKRSFGILRVKEAFEFAFDTIDKAFRQKSYFKVNPNRFVAFVYFITPLRFLRKRTMLALSFFTLI